MFNLCEQHNVDMEVQEIKLIEEICENDSITSLCIFDPLKMALAVGTQFIEKFNLHDTYQFIGYINDIQYLYTIKKLSPPRVEVPTLKLKSLHEDIKHAFVGPKKIFSVVFSMYFVENQKEQLPFVLHTHKNTLGAFQGYVPYHMHALSSSENDAKATRHMQYCLNSVMKEVVKREILKLLDACIIYPIIDSK